MAAAFVTCNGALAGVSSNSAGLPGLNFKETARQNRKLSFKAGVNLAILRPGATWSTASRRSMKVSKLLTPLAPSMKKVTMACAIGTGAESHNIQEEQSQEPSQKIHNIYLDPMTGAIYQAAIDQIEELFDHVNEQDAVYQEPPAIRTGEWQRLILNNNFGRPAVKFKIDLHLGMCYINLHFEERESHAR